jgi:hypothetical protein
MSRNCKTPGAYLMFLEPGCGAKVFFKDTCPPMPLVLRFATLRRECLVPSSSKSALPLLFCFFNFGFNDFFNFFGFGMRTALDDDSSSELPNEPESDSFPDSSVETALDCIDDASEFESKGAFFSSSSTSNLTFLTVFGLPASLVPALADRNGFGDPFLGDAFLGDGVSALGFGGDSLRSGEADCGRRSGDVLPEDDDALAAAASADDDRFVRTRVGLIATGGVTFTVFS